MATIRERLLHATNGTGRVRDALIQVAKSEKVEGIADVLLFDGDITINGRNFHVKRTEKFIYEKGVLIVYSYFDSMMGLTAEERPLVGGWAKDSRGGRQGPRESREERR